MKRIFAMMLVVLMLFGFVGCGEEEPAVSRWPEDSIFGVQVSHGGWTDDDAMYTLALNTALMSENSVRHLPIYRFDLQSDLTQFCEHFGETMALDQPYDGVKSFTDVAAAYDEAFFEEHSLIVVYVAANSGSYRYGVESIAYGGAALTVHVQQTNDPEGVTEDMEGWFVTAAVKDAELEHCTGYDADLIGNAD